VNDPPVILADEPTGNLDSATTREIMRLLQRLNREGTTILMVTHSQDCAAYAERILQVSDGRLVDKDEHRTSNIERPTSNEKQTSTLMNS